MDNFLEKLDINNNLNIVSEKLSELQNNYLNSNLKTIIDTGINIGLKAILPDFIENQIIELKDSIINNGIKEGINDLINSSIELGKTATGILTGNFENVSQIQMAVKKGGLIDGLSDILDLAIKVAQDNKIIDKNTAKTLKNGKNQILKEINKNIENNLSNQVESIEKINTYTKSWKESFENRDFNSMEKAYKKIEKEMEKIVPLENIIIDVRKIENMHNLIKNNGKDFNISDNEISLAKKLID